MKLLLTALILFLLAAPATAQDMLTGTVTHVRDGDTIEVADVPVRLNGVAAPELDEPRGREGKKFMLELVGGKTVRCELNGERSYDRVIGTCYLDGADIGESVIAAGLARDCPRFSRGRYDKFNSAASKRLPLPGYCVRR
jgi:micrococcal nuclease